MIITDQTVVHQDSLTQAHEELRRDEAKVLIATVGYPRCGKSTWAKSQGYPIVCPDEIRRALHGHRYIAEAEPFVWAIAKVMVRALFGAGHQFVILDACNIGRKRRDEWVSSEWAVRYKYFSTPDSVCVARAISIGDFDLVPVINRMAEEFEPGGEDEIAFV